MYDTEESPNIPVFASFIALGRMLPEEKLLIPSRIPPKRDRRKAERKLLPPLISSRQSRQVRGFRVFPGRMERGCELSIVQTIEENHAKFPVSATSAGTRQ